MKVLERDHVVGHVPANLCGVMSTCMTVHICIDRVLCLYTGGIINGQAIPGSGQQLPCCYLVLFKKSINQPPSRQERGESSRNAERKEKSEV